jgi:hypothetical protein
VFYLVFKFFLGIFASVSDACFKYFIYLQTYVASVASECFKSRSAECFKSRSGISSPSSFFVPSSQCLLLLLSAPGWASAAPSLLS